MRISQTVPIIQKAIESQLEFRISNGGRDAQRLIPYLQGKAGLGKTTSIISVCEANDNWSYFILSLAQFDAGELMGVIAMDGDNAKRLKPHWLVHVEQLASDSDVVVLFCDELAQAPVANMNVARQLINELRCGDFMLPDNVVIVAAGNRVSDRAGANNIPTHMKDCLMFLDVEADLDDAVGYLSSKGISPVITGFMRFRPELLNKVDRDADANPSPRSYERLDTVLSWGLPEPVEKEAVAGILGRGVCAEFYGYKPIFDSAITVDEVLANPTSAPVPEEPAVCYAVTSALAHAMTDKNVGAITQYLARFVHKEFYVLAMKDAFKRTPSLKQTPEFRAFLLEHGAELML